MNAQPFSSDKEILESYAARINRPRVERLAALGLDFVYDRAEGARVFDTAGKSYIDCWCSGGQLVLGHRRPEVVAAMRRALKHLDLGNFVLLSAQKAALAKTLAAAAPGELKCTVYGVGRAEANDFAMKLARGFSGRQEIICFEGAHHGQTGFALSVSDDPPREKLFGPLIPQVKRLPLDAAALRRAVSSKTAAVIVEPVQSDAGVLFPPKSFLAEARRACDRSGAALIFDEGQLALGRTGKLFALEHSNVVPDVLTVSKGIAGGLYPISAAVFTPRLNRFMLMHPLIHLSTFAGSDIGCVVAIAAIEIIRREKLWENARKQGARLLAGLEDVADSHPDKISEARGQGLLVALETKSADTADALVRGLATRGVLALQAPASPAVVRFTPPIDISEDDIDEIIDAAGDAAESL